jgi:adenine-specific DNA glycosylase
MLSNTIDFRRSLLGWYQANRRDLPWRVAKETPTSAKPDP